MDHAHMDHGHMDHGDHGMPGMDHGHTCNMNVRYALRSLLYFSRGWG